MNTDCYIEKENIFKNVTSVLEYITLIIKRMFILEC